MPREDKEKIMRYRIPMPSVEEQQEIIDKVENLENEIKDARLVIGDTGIQKQRILDKYLS